MDSRDSEALRKRVERLEEEVKLLSKTVFDFRQQFTDTPDRSATPISRPGSPEIQTELPDTPAPPPPPPPGPQTSPSKPAQFKLPERMRSFEYWLNRVGIGLTLFGIAFLFKYSVDQGWITPWLRIGFAFALGSVLCGLGLRLYLKRQNFAVVLLGGAIGVWYITGFSAFQLLELVTQVQAMSFMVAVTIFAFTLSIRQNVALLALIGALGGFGTPFLLYTGSGNLPGLVMFTCVIVAMTSGLFFYKGWRSLLWLSVISGWIVFMIGIGSRSWTVADNGSYTTWVVQAGLAYLWIAFTGLPLIRELAWLKNPDRWAKSTIGFADKKLTKAMSVLLDRHLHVLALTSALLGFTLSMIIWTGLSDDTWGLIAAGLSLIYAATAFYLNRFTVMKALRYTYGLIGLFWFTLALTLFLDGNALLVSLATEAMVLHLIATRTRSSPIRIATHILSFVVGTWLWSRLSNAGDVFIAPPKFWSATNLAELWTIITFGVSAKAIKEKIGRQIYLIATVVLLTMLLLRQFEGNVELMLLGLEAFAVYLLARIIFDRPVLISAHLLYILGSVFVIARFTATGIDSTPLLNIEVMADLMFVTLIAIVAAVDEERWIRWTYALATHLAILGLFASELSRLENGHGWVSVSWGVYGALLLIVGLRVNFHPLRLAGVGTLGLLVVKLFLVDLARLETIWRVLLFIGVGGSFLALSYFFPALWKGDQDPKDPKDLDEMN